MTMNPLDAITTLRQPRASAMQLERVQARRLRQIMQRAATVPHYRTRFGDAGIDPGSIRTAADLVQLPVTTRAEIQQVPIERRLAERVDPNRMKSFFTSGSTGHPVRILQSRSNNLINGALTLRSCWHYGLRPWHRRMTSRNSMPSSTPLTWLSRLGVFQKDYIMIAQQADQWCQQVRRFQPHCIMVYLTCLRVLAEYILEHHITDCRPLFIISVGEMLDPTTRHTIEKAFDAPVYDVYGSWEGGIMAAECPQCGGYHVNSDWVIVEILCDGRPVQPGEEGDVVITNLHNWSTPFVRYAQGDRAVWQAGPSVCGSPFPLLKKICGRQSDSLIAPSGATISPVSFLTLISPIPGIQLWRLIQVERDLLRLEVCADAPLDAATMTALREQLSLRMGAPMRLEVHYHKDLVQRDGNKFRRVICRVDRDDEGATGD